MNWLIISLFLVREGGIGLSNKGLSSYW